MTTTVATAPPRGSSHTLELYRDDGPLASLLAPLGRRAPVPAVVLPALAVLLAVVGVAAAGADVGDAALGGVLGAAILLAGASRGKPHRGRLAWVLPFSTRALEYIGIVWIAAAAGPSAVPAAFALLAAVAYRHYELVYRMRHRGEPPPRWISLAGAGWDGRLVIAYGLLVAGALPAAMFAWAALLGVLFVAESVRSWTRFTSASPLGADEEEENE